MQIHTRSACLILALCVAMVLSACSGPDSAKGAAQMVSPFTLDALKRRSLAAIDRNKVPLETAQSFPIPTFWRGARTVGLAFVYDQERYMDGGFAVGDPIWFNVVDVMTGEVLVNKVPEKGDTPNEYFFLQYPWIPTQKSARSDEILQYRVQDTVVIEQSFDLLLKNPDFIRNPKFFHETNPATDPDSEEVIFALAYFRQLRQSHALDGLNPDLFGWRSNTLKHSQPTYFQKYLHSVQAHFGRRLEPFTPPPAPTEPPPKIRVQP